MVTGKGVPDLSTRQLVHRLSAEGGLPAAALVDCDPFGIEIMFVYKYGSLAMAWSAEWTAVPSLQWIGLLSHMLLLQLILEKGFVDLIICNMCYVELLLGEISDMYFTGTFLLSSLLF